MRLLTSIVILAALVASATVCPAQIARTEVTKPTADDAKPNSSKVPDVYSTPVSFERTLVLRFKNGADLLEGLERSVKENGIRNAVILSGIGSAVSYHYHVVSNATFPSKNTYVKNPAAPVDIASVSGYVIGGRVHAHAVFADADKAFGGHLEAGTKVFTFAIVTIGVVPSSVDFSRLDDKSYR